MLVAAEASGDALGAELARALGRRLGEGQVRFVGVGGVQMAGEGVQSPFDIGELSILGRILEGLMAYPRVVARVPRDRGPGGAREARHRDPHRLMGFHPARRPSALRRLRSRSAARQICRAPGLGDTGGAGANPGRRGGPPSDHPRLRRPLFRKRRPEDDLCRQSGPGARSLRRRRRAPSRSDRRRAGRADPPRPARQPAGRDRAGCRRRSSDAAARLLAGRPDLEVAVPAAPTVAGPGQGAVWRLGHRPHVDRGRGR